MGREKQNLAVTHSFHGFYMNINKVSEHVRDTQFSFIVIFIYFLDSHFLRCEANKGLSVYRRDKKAFVQIQQIGPRTTALG